MISKRVWIRPPLAERWCKAVVLFFAAQYWICKVLDTDKSAYAGNHYALVDGRWKARR